MLFRQNQWRNVVYVWRDILMFHWLVLIVIVKSVYISGNIYTISVIFAPADRVQFVVFITL